jgi:hypothetical protein
LSPIKFLSLSLLLALPASAENQVSAGPPSESAPSANYVTVMAGTTLAYLAPEAPISGPVGDVTPMVGYGRYLTPTLAVELDFGPTFTSGGTSYTLSPGVVWAFSQTFYAAVRLLIALHPTPNFGFFPGLGATWVLPHGFSLFSEVNVATMVAQGPPDLGLSLTVGTAYSF